MARLQKYFDSPPAPFDTRKSLSRLKIKNPLSHFCLPGQILSKMVKQAPVAPKTMDLQDFREKA